MPDIWMDVDAALAEVPVNILPLIDDTDFKTIEGAVAYDAAGMTLRWHFVTSAGAYTVTSVTPTTAGNYDWTDQGDSGIYTIEIPASGGASINNDTEGYGWFTGVATGVLPWRGPVIGFRAAGLNDLLTDSAYSTTRGLAGTALPAAAADSAGGLPISDAGGLDLDAQIGADIDAILVDTSTTLDDLIDTEIATIISVLGTPAGASISADIAAIEAQTDDIGVAGAGLTAVPWNAAWDAEVQSEVADALAVYDPPTKAELDAAVANVSVDEIQATALADLFNTDSATTYASAVAGSVVKEIADNAGGSALTVQDIVDGVWDELTAGHVTADTFGKAVADILVDTGTTLDGKLNTIDDFLDTEVAAILADTNELQTDWVDGGRLDLILDARASQTSVNTIDDFLDTEVAAILADTNELQTDWVDGGRLDLILDARASQASVNTVDDFLDTEIAAIISTLGTPAGVSLSADVAAVKVDTAAILVDTGTTLDGKIDTIDGIVDSILVDTAEIGAAGAGLTAVAVGTGGIASTSFAAGAIDAAAIAANAIGASELAQGAAQEIADEVLNRDIAGGASGNTRNVRNALRGLRNKVTIAAGTATIYQEDDLTEAWTAAVATAAGDPISEVDPV